MMNENRSPAKAYDFRRENYEKLRELVIEVNWTEQLRDLTVEEAWNLLSQRIKIIWKLQSMQGEKLVGKGSRPNWMNNHLKKAVRSNKGA